MVELYVMRRVFTLEAVAVPPSSSRRRSVEVGSSNAMLSSAPLLPAMLPERPKTDLEVGGGGGKEGGVRSE